MVTGKTKVTSCRSVWGRLVSLLGASYTGANSLQFSDGLRAACSGELPTQVMQPGASPQRYI